MAMRPDKVKRQGEEEESKKRKGRRGDRGERRKEEGLREICLYKTAGRSQKTGNRRPEARGDGERETDHTGAIAGQLWKVHTHMGINT